MCDYSLEMYASRPAREFEKYVTTRFPSGSIGLAAPGDCTTAVCVQYDTPLKLEGISSELQRHLGVGPSESVVFERIRHGRNGQYSDGVKFPNGKEISLQLLGPGVTITLVQAKEKTKAIHARENALELIA
jgi:hypothetical protein